MHHFNFENPYNRTDFVQFLGQFLPDDFTPDNSPIKEEDLKFSRNYTSSVTRLGVCKQLDLEAFEIAHTSTRDARVGTSREAFRLMLHNSYHNKALIAFIPEGSTQYRFSLLQIEAEQKETSARITHNYSHPCRFSYLLGEGAHVKTPQQYLSEKGKIKFKDGSLFNDLLERFSIEALTKQFYKELFDWYQWALSDNDGFAVTYPNDIDTDTDDRIIEEHLIRLITRLMFVWFIKQKGLIPKQIFDSGGLTAILNNFDPESRKSGNYYNAILQNLFFATLNRPINERKFASCSSSSKNDGKEHYGIKTLFRDDNHETYFQHPHEAIIDLFKPVPFLNGGLFECLDKEKDDTGKIFYFDGFSREKGRQRRAFIPNCLFFNPERGLISILKKYNFTIEENTPNDIEVALDPELLGKVFENLLGAYNPETKETARKQSGSFYTPREIVNYMVDESLIAYLKQRVGEEYENEYRQLLVANTDSITEEIQLKISSALYQIKILDPACGSGAFPMGILSRIIDILKKLQPHINLYETKLQIIENCIYGIDIQTIAIQISKLRFFISLICEQVANENPNLNYGILPLPNLESKFVAANTLTPLDEERKNQLNLEDEELKQMKNELWDIRCHKNLRASSWQEKKQLRDDDKKLCKKIEGYLFKNSGKPNNAIIERNKKQIEQDEAELAHLPEIWVDDYQKVIQTSLFGESTLPTLFKKDINKDKRDKINERIKLLKAEISKEEKKGQVTGLEAEIKKMTYWNPYDQNSTSPFFDPEWMFGLKEGFDVVIGNPPYVQLQNNGGELAKLYEKCGYKTFARTGDLYCLFYERGYQLLKSLGRLCFITSNKWMRAGYGESSRKFLTENTNPEQLIDFAGVKVFESATVDTNILMFAKDKNRQQTQACIVKKEGIKDLSVFIRQSSSVCHFGSGSWVVLSPIEQRIKAKIEAVGTPLKDWDIQINYGIKTGFNDAFIISGEKRKELIKQDPKSEKIIRPILRGRDIKRYGYDFADLWLINTHNGIKEKGVKPIDINNYPVIKNHLDKYYPELEKRADKGDTPYNLRNCTYMEDFYKQKIVYPNMTKFLPFYFDNLGFYQNDKSFMIIGKHLAYLTAFFNSSLFKYCFIDNFPELQGGTRELRKIFFDPLPVLKVNDSINNIFYYKISEIQTLRCANKNTKELEIEIDNMIFDLYQLHNNEKDEIGFIEIQ